jgi:hypothetical protein
MLVRLLTGAIFIRRRAAALLLILALSFRHMATPDQSVEERVSNLESRVAGNSRYERLTKIITVLGAVVAFAWGLYQYVDARKMEFRKGFWEKQFTLYSRASKAAAEIAIAPDLESVKKERAEFWTLYWGELSIVESKGVHDAMVEFGKGLSELEANPERPGSLKQKSYFLARACRESLKTTWEPVPLDDIPVKTTWDKEPNSKD